MTFVLSENRRGSPAEILEGFQRYREYLRAREAQFPPSAYQLATSDWYFSLSGSRGPHDSWLQEARICEESHPGLTGNRRITITLRLINSSHDGLLEFTYPDVLRYTLDLSQGDRGHRDWRYDEFRLSETGHVIHEIEWWGPEAVGRWTIVASDVVLKTIPFVPTGSA